MHTTRKEFAREPSERMSIERAFEILDPTHRERYENLEPVNEACRMGRAALFLQMKESPYEAIDLEPPTAACDYDYHVRHGARVCFR